MVAIEFLPLSAHHRKTTGWLLFLMCTRGRPRWPDTRPLCDPQMALLFVIKMVLSLFFDEYVAALSVVFLGSFHCGRESPRQEIGETRGLTFHDGGILRALLRTWHLQTTTPKQQHLEKEKKNRIWATLLDLMFSRHKALKPPAFQSGNGLLSDFFFLSKGSVRAGTQPHTQRNLHTLPSFEYVICRGGEKKNCGPVPCKYHRPPRGFDFKFDSFKCTGGEREKNIYIIHTHVMGTSLYIIKLSPCICTGWDWEVVRDMAVFPRRDAMRLTHSSTCQLNIYTTQSTLKAVISFSRLCCKAIETTCDAVAIDNGATPRHTKNRN